MIRPVGFDGDRFITIGMFFCGRIIDINTTPGWRNRTSRCIATEVDQTGSVCGEH